jgi:hypothetical protein
MASVTLLVKSASWFYSKKISSGTGDTILYNFPGINFVAFLHAYIFEDQLAILFNLLTIEYPVSMLWQQHDVVSNLATAMAKTMQFQCLSHPCHRWVS